MPTKEMAILLKITLIIILTQLAFTLTLTLPPTNFNSKPNSSLIPIPTLKY